MLKQFSQNCDAHIGNLLEIKDFKQLKDESFKWQSFTLRPEKLVSLF